MFTRHLTLSLAAALLLAGCANLPQSSMPVATTAVLKPAAKPGYRPGTAHIYINRRLEQVVSTRNGRTLWKDQNGRRFSRDDNFVVPTLSWRTDKGVYTQRVVKGEPDRLFPLGRGEEVWFDVLKHRPDGREFTQIWRCTDAGGRVIDWQQQRLDTYLVSCVRHYLRSGYVRTETQRLDYYYAPDPGAVVRIDYIDLRMRRAPEQKLLAIRLDPDEASAERIATERARLSSIASRGADE